MSEITIDIQPPPDAGYTAEAVEIVSALELELDRLGYRNSTRKNRWMVGSGWIDGFTVTAEKKG